MVQISVNENCIIARNTEKGIYTRCKNCDLKLHQCFSMHVNLVIFLLVALAMSIIAYYRSNPLIVGGGVLVTVLLLLLAKTTDEKTNQLFLMGDELRTLSRGLEYDRRESEMRYERLFGGNPSALYVIDLNGHFLEVNKKFTEVAGYKSSDLEGKHLEDLFPMKDRARIMHYHQEKIKHKDRPFEYEMPLVTKDKRTIIVKIRANVDSKGRFAVGSLDDITQRKKMEKQIREYTEHLVQKVDERTGELKMERDKLEYSTRELKKSNELKDLFTDIMRHDLLNQVGAIENSSELILDMNADSEVKDLTGIIHRSAGRLVELIADASSYAALEELRDIDLEQFDINDILNDVIEANERLAEEKRITVVFNRGELHTFSASSMIKDVFSNILSNAIKYSPENTKIEIDVQKGPPCVVSIKDNGMGIPNEEKGNIFKRFTRLKKKGIQGSGLGLAIVQRIVDLHNGRVWVEDNPEGGSIFKVELPH